MRVPREMWRSLSFLLVLSVSAAEARQFTFAWDAGIDWPSGTTVELEANGAAAVGIVDRQYTLDVPIQPGGVLSARARAIAPDSLGSSWTTLAATLPSDPAGVWAKQHENEIPVMAAPTYVNQYATAFNSTTSPKTAMSAVAVTAGDVLVAVAAAEGYLYGPIGVTENGGGSWAAAQGANVTDNTEVRAWSYVVPGNETLTATFTRTDYYFGGNIVRFSGSDGIGNSAINSGASGSPSVNITTTQANSAIVVICGDWNAVSGTQTFTNNFSGTPTALTDYTGDTSHYGVAIAYFPDAGAAGSKTVGMSAPTGQKWYIIAVEVKGAAGAATAVPVFMNQYRQRRN